MTAEAEKELRAYSLGVGHRVCWQMVDRGKNVQ